MVAVVLCIGNMTYAWPLPAGIDRVTAAEFKEEVRVKAKLLYHKKLCFVSKGIAVGDSAALPLSPTPIDVLGPDSIVKMLELHLRSGRYLKKPLPMTLWQRLRTCGRVPPDPVAHADVAARVWLGDYAGARAAAPASDSALADAIQRFTVELSGAAEKSKAFKPKTKTAEVARLGLQKLGGLAAVCSTYKTDDGVPVSCVLLSAPPGDPSAYRTPALLLHWGGNGEQASEVASVPQLRESIALGALRAVLVDYRGYGWSGGTPSLETLRGDADALFRALPGLLAANGIEWPYRGPIVLMGRSLGATCALYLAVLHAGEVAGLILECPVCCHWPFDQVPEGAWASLGEHLPALSPARRTFHFCACCRAGGSKQDRREASWLDMMDLAHMCSMPLLVLSGTADDVCRPEQIESLYRASSAPDKSFARIEGKMHHDVGESPDYWKHFRGFISRVMQNHGLDRPPRPFECAD